MISSFHLTNIRKTSQLGVFSRLRLVQYYTFRYFALLCLFITHLRPVIYAYSRLKVPSKNRKRLLVVSVLPTSDNPLENYFNRSTGDLYNGKIHFHEPPS